MSEHGARGAPESSAAMTAKPEVRPEVAARIWDVIIVGAGGAGLAAAATAAQSGASVLVLEKEGRPGGTTAIAIGSITAPGTDLQKARGITDDVASFQEDSRAFLSEAYLARDDPARRAFLAREAPATMDWLRTLRVPFVGPFPEPPHRVPRMHNVVPGSRAYVAVLSSLATANGALIHTGTRVVELLRDRGGRVTGVRVAVTRQPEATFTARRGVILATGDYSANDELKSRHLHPMACLVGAANPRATGDGHVLGGQVGAKLVNMDIAKGPQLRFAPPAKPGLLERMPYRPRLASAMAAVANRLPMWVLRLFAKQMLTAWMAPAGDFLTSTPLLVGRDGKRIQDCGEGLPYAVTQAPDKSAYLIIDAATARRYSSGDHYISTAPGVAYAYFGDYRRGRPDLFFRGATLKELARCARIDIDGLRATVDSLKTAAPASHRGLISGPVYALGPLLPVFTTTEGGIEISERCEVLRDDGQPIHGLYAAGSVGQGGLILAGHGLHILWALTTGRIAGREAASR